MVLAGRTSRRGGGRRWLVAGLVVTVLVLLIDASIKSRSPTPGRQLAAQAWLVRADELVVQSNVQSQELAGFRSSSASGLSAARVTADLDDMTTGARSSYRTLLTLHEPLSLQNPAALLQTCLFERSQAADEISSAVQASLRTRSPSTAASSAQAFAAAVAKLRLGDLAYAQFAANVPKSLGTRSPASTWVSDASAYSATNLQVFLASLQTRVSLAPMHQLDIITIGTTPSVIRTTGAGGSIAVLSPSSELLVTAVVGDTGNQSESDLTVTAAISASSGVASASRYISLSAGQTNAISFAPLGPRLGAPTTLTVTVTPAAGSPTKAVSRSLRFEMPSPGSSTTTTTTTTTVPTATTAKPGTTTPST